MTEPTPAADPAVALLTRGASWVTVGQLAPLAVSIVLTPYLIHGFGAAQYGLLLVCTSATAFLAGFDGGLSSSLSRYYAVYAATEDLTAASALALTIGVLVMAVSALAFAVLFFAGPHLLPLFHTPGRLRGEGTFLLRSMAFVLLATQLRGVFAGQLSARQMFGAQTGVTVLSYGIYAVIAAESVRHHYNLRGMAVALIAQATASTLLLIPLACRYFTVRELRFLSRSETWAFVKYSTQVQTVGIVSLINSEVDTLLIGGFVSVSSVSIYGPGASLALQLRAVPVNALAPMATMLARAFGSGGEEQAVREFDRLQRLWVRGVTGWSAVAVSAAYFGVAAWLGPHYHRSGVVACILLAGLGVNLWTGALTLLLNAVGRPGIEAAYSAVSIVINLALTVPFIVAFGVIGCVIATSLGSAVSSIYLIRLTRRRFRSDIRSFLADVPIAPSVAAMAVVVLIELALRPIVPSGYLGLLLCGLAASPGLLLYYAWIIGPRAFVARTLRRP